MSSLPEDSAGTKATGKAEQSSLTRACMLRVGEGLQCKFNDTPWDVLLPPITTTHPLKEAVTVLSLTGSFWGVAVTKVLGQAQL
jgi:hypothetical protein